MPNLARRAPILALLILPLTFSSARAASRDWDHSFPVGAHPPVHVRTDDGRVRIHPGPDGTVKATVHWESKHWGLTSPSREPVVRFEKTGDAVEIEVREPSAFAIFGGISERIFVDVTVPSECDLRVRTGDGALSLEAPLHGSFELSTGDGHVTLQGVRGDIHVTSGDGAIDGTDLDGNLFARASDGAVRLDGRFDALDVRTGDGHVDVTARKGSKLDTDWSVETSDATLALLIPRDLRATLDARTSDGRIRFDLPVTASGLDHHVIRGKINGGGPTLRLRTGDGTLTLGTSD